MASSVPWLVCVRDVQRRRYKMEYKMVRLPWLWIEHRAFRSSVWRSPNWAIKAYHSANRLWIAIFWCSAQTTLHTTNHTDSFILPLKISHKIIQTQTIKHKHQPQSKLKCQHQGQSMVHLSCPQANTMYILQRRTTLQSSLLPGPCCQPRQQERDIFSYHTFSTHC